MSLSSGEHRSCLALVVALFCSWATTVSSDCNEPGFRVASYYSSNMVLQRPPARPRVWGYAPNADDMIILQLNDGSQTAMAKAFYVEAPEAQLIWEAVFDPITSTGPHTITINFRSCVITLANILIGDVWICSGQSNMEMKLREVDSPEDEIKNAADREDIRLFVVKQKISDVPESEPGIVRNWILPSSDLVSHFSAICWLFGRNLYNKYRRPIGLIESSWGGTRIQAWTSHKTLSECFTAVTQPASRSNRASVLFNAMIHPFIRMPIFGAIWYQGEANIRLFGEDQMLYSCALKAMVADWRKRWHSSSPHMNDAFPFGVVQIAPWRDGEIQDGFPDIRWAQTDSFGYLPNPNMKNYFLAVAIDLPDFHAPHAIHPRYKRQIADRLSLAAFNVAYGSTDTGIYQGPLPITFYLDGKNIRIGYSVQIAHRTTLPNNFELCCGTTTTMTCNSGGQWVCTEPRSKGSDYIQLEDSCDALGKIITGFRYLWRESPCRLEDCPIYSMENNLPAPPYIYHGHIAPGHIFSRTDTYAGWRFTANISNSINIGEYGFELTAVENQNVEDIEQTNYIGSTHSSNTVEFSTTKLQNVCSMHPISSDASLTCMVNFLAVFALTLLIFRENLQMESLCG